jgi:cytochrome c-type biogenesis protein CcmH/NrfG
MATAAIALRPTLPARQEPAVPAVPWRDPYTASRVELSAYIADLERQCFETPRFPEAWTCLGIARAVNYDVVDALDALSTATEVDPSYFWARLKYGELHYRLRALDLAEQETLKAVDLAENPWQLSIARKQLKEIRALNPRRVRRDAPASPLGRALFFVGLLVVSIAVVAWA